MSNKKSDSKNQNNKLIDKAAEKLAEIFYMQIEWMKRKKKIY